MFAHTAILPELSHNEVEIWNKNASKLLKPVFIRHPEEPPPKIAKRFKIIKQIIEDAGFEVNEVWETGNNHLNRLLRSLYLLDYTAIYTAILREEDPSKTPNTETVKRNMHKYIVSPSITQKII